MRIHRVFIASLIAVALTASAFAQSNGFDIARMDRSAEACTDFFQFANGNWLKETTIPDSESRWGSFNILAENNREILKTVLEEASAETSADKGSSEQLTGDFYASCIAEDAIERAGARPLMPYLRQIERIRTRDDLIRHVAKMHNMGVGAIFGFGGGPDLKDSKMYIANAGQGGLSMPNKDYYVDGDPKFQENRDKFREYMQKMFMLLGKNEEDARKDAFTVMRIQVELAYASLRRVELRDPDKRYKKVSLDEAESISPNLDWKDYMAFRGAPEVDSFNIGQPDFFKAVSGMLKDVSVEEWKTYLKWMTIDAAAPALSKEFRDANFDFYGKYLQGRKEQHPRWRQCVQATDGSVGEALGQEYVSIAFKPEAKERMNELIDNLFEAFRGRLDNLEWMGDETKTQALAKLLTFKRKIGYPDKLRGYEGLNIERGSYIENVRASTEFQIKRNLQDIGKPVDPDRWFMTPPTVNAYYNPLVNEIVFPAGILQPPFFDFDADDAINYGAIGAVIGHEITHGFDDQGSRFDADGNLKMWWTSDDREKFDERASCVVDQFSGYEVQPGLFMDGKLGLGENIADLGGLTVAYDAFINSMKKNGRQKDIDGFTPEQRFFLGWAQVWAMKATQEAERLQVATGPHALARWRVNGPVSNMPQFAEAFKCGNGSEMVRKDYCQIW
ncbi:MAG: M13 family peptidase [Acidobacteria bacterium]|nr:MAG: M13 family peptidase [Acidobacteriota bacterium]REJ98835.1 MAG: M13 family peptidase [Acidobacteriota bacterium]REK16445.1 MAG: M13 family peptidase [Acidobacteriota bacterium]REK44126.1 MAG: M13 family peptidase [Acidobacteriota bacterium]